jgi:hypothetical protein
MRPHLFIGGRELKTSSPLMGEVAAKRPEGVEQPPHPSRASARSTLPIKGREA